MGESAHLVSYWLHPEAEVELGDAAVYYAEHASRSVAEAFIAEFELYVPTLHETVTQQVHSPAGPLQ